MAVEEGVLIIRTITVVPHAAEAVLKGVYNLGYY